MRPSPAWPDERVARPPEEALTPARRDSAQRKGAPRSAIVIVDTSVLLKIGPGQVLVRVGFGGICGSDLHYFHHGGFGTVRIQQPMVLGHEVAGSVATVADDVTSVVVGDRV